MKLVPFILTLIVAWPVAPVSRGFGQNPSAKAPSRISLRTLIPYKAPGFGFESLPVQVVSAGAGKFGPREKFKIFVSSLRNQTGKEVKAIKLSGFILKFGGWGIAPLETIETALIPLNLLAFEQQDVDILVGYVDDRPSLGFEPDPQTRMEVAVSEVQYADGSIWQGTDLPQKLFPNPGVSLKLSSTRQLAEY